MPFIPLEVSALYTSLFYKAALVAQSLTPPFGEVHLQFLTSTLGVPLSQPRVDLVDAAILFVDMSGDKTEVYFQKWLFIFSSERRFYSSD